MIQLRAVPFGHLNRYKRISAVTGSPAEGTRGPSRARKIKTVLAYSALLVLTPAALGLTYLTVMLIRVRSTIPTVAQIAAFEPVSATTIYSSDGVLLATLQIENRKPVSLKEMSPQLVQATLAVEDCRFYDHNGVDFRGVGRALFSNLISRDMSAQGGSTITQQLARNISKFGLSKEKSLYRKLREAMTAVRIEQVFDKDTILELYLNQIYYGSGAYGVEAAARTYFGKSVSKLDLAESALLAGLPQRPVAFSPFSNPNGALNRRNAVLKRMLDTNQISLISYERAKSEPLNITPRHAGHTGYRAPYFVDWIVKGLVDKYGMDSVYSGWKVVTTLDWRMQERAEQAIRRGMHCGATQGALVSIDPHNGEVRAMVGGVDYQKDRFNAITQGLRQPGSAFKPIVYASAFEYGGLSLDSQFKDAELTIPSTPKPWRVRNSSGEYLNRDVTILEAITRSINTVAVETAQETGLPNIIDIARRMGITTDLAPYLPIALGSSAVRPIELCEAYTVFASGGSRHQPVGIRSIEDNFGRRVEFERGSELASVLQSNTIDQMNAALRSVVTRGTGMAAGTVSNAFGKTGTTTDNRDAWFVGYTPELVTAVWVANPTRDKRGVMHYEVMPGATGGRVAAPIWATFMGSAVPIQQKVNRERGLTAWTINLRDLGKPGSKSTENTLVLDETTNDYLKGITPSAAQTDKESQDAESSNGIQTADYRGQSNHSIQSAAFVEDTTGNSESSPRGGTVVRVCSVTGKLATEWCDTTILIDSSSKRAPAEYCRKHRAPFGEP